MNLRGAVGHALSAHRPLQFAAFGSLARLQRSLDKFKNQGAEFHFDEQAWQCLSAGYDDYEVPGFGADGDH